MSRKIIICIDGTGNEVGDRETNVLKLYKALDKRDQLARYVMGVGTYDGPLMFGRLRQAIKGTLGLAFGFGLEDDVLEAYRYLCENYQSAKMKEATSDLPKGSAEDDHIYLIGFSRGAYAARILAGFIHNFGLVRPEVLHLIPPVFRAYRKVTDFHRSASDDEVFQTLREFDAVLKPFPAPIRALGLFDTVSSLVRFRRPWFNFKTYGSLAELGTHASISSNVSVRIVVQALAIDERRAMFRALPWREDGKEAHTYFANRFRHASKKRQQYVRQRWFPGFHSDIGGSPSENVSGIGKLTLLWMLDALSDAEKLADREDVRERADQNRADLPDAGTRMQGLRLKTGARDRYFLGTKGAKTPGGLPYCGPNPLAPIHDSILGDGKPRLSWFWLVLEILPKSLKRREPGKPRWFRRGLIWFIPAFEPRHIPLHHSVDDSAYIRQSTASAKYNPPNLPARD